MARLLIFFVLAASISHAEEPFVLNVPSLNKKQRTVTRQSEEPTLKIPSIVTNGTCTLGAYLFTRSLSGRIIEKERRKQGLSHLGCEYFNPAFRQNEDGFSNVSDSLGWAFEEEDLVMLAYMVEDPIAIAKEVLEEAYTFTEQRLFIDLYFAMIFSEDKHEEAIEQARALLSVRRGVGDAQYYLELRRLQYDYRLELDHQATLKIVESVSIENRQSLHHLLTGGVHTFDPSTREAFYEGLDHRRSADEALNLLARLEESVIPYSSYRKVKYAKASKRFLHTVDPFHMKAVLSDDETIDVINSLTGKELAMFIAIRNGIELSGIETPLHSDPRTHLSLDEAMTLSKRLADLDYSPNTVRQNLKALSDEFIQLQTVEATMKVLFAMNSTSQSPRLLLRTIKNEGWKVDFEFKETADNLANLILAKTPRPQ